ncbi:MAG: hypothetical protein E7491_02645 [Ruminococcaceae bacterium]|nr:hypothetical protein [Oscillospiraceae bacterium]
MDNKTKKPLGSRLMSAVPAVSLICGLLAALIRIMQGKAEGAAENSLASFLPFIVLAVSAIFMVIALALGNKRLWLKESGEFLKIKQMIPPAMSLLAGLLIIADYGVLLYRAMTANSAEQIQPVFLVIAILGVLSGVFFIFNAYMFYVGHSKFRKISFLAVIPSVWIIILLSVTFMKLSTIANISAYYYDIVAYCAMLVFLFSYAKAVASMGKPKILFVSGALFTSCALAATLPRIFMWEFLTLTAEDVAFSPLMVFAVLALALFAEESLGTMLNYDADAPVAAKEQANKDSDGETASEQAVDNVTEGVSENIEE